MRTIWYSSVLLVFLFTSTGCLKKSAPFRLADVSDAPAHIKEQRLEFQAVIRPELGGTHEWRSSGGASSKTPGSPSRPKWKHVIPVTESNWTKSDPVTLWVTFTSFRKDVSKEVRALQSAISAGYVLGKFRDFPGREIGVLRGASAWQNAVVDAETRHGIKSDPRAPIVVWVP